MRVAHLLGPGTTGTALRSLLAQASGLAGRGHTVSVLWSAPEEPPPAPPGVAVVRPGPVGTTAAHEAELARLVRELEADVLVTTEVDLLAPAAALAPSRVALVHQEPRPTDPDRPGEPAEPVVRHAVLADLVTVPSEGEAAMLRDRVGAAGTRVTALPAASAPGFKPRATLREPVVVAVGDLVPSQRHSAALSAFATVARALPDWRLRIVGTGPRRAQLQRLTRMFGLYDRVELVAPVAGFAHELAQASVAVSAAADAGGAGSLVEAMAVGLPSVVGDGSAAARELLEHDRTGLLVPHGSTQELAAALLALARDPAARDRMGAAAVERARPLAAGPAAERWEALLQEVVAAPRRQARHVVPRAAGPRAPGPSTGPSAGPPVSHLVAGVTPQQSRAAALRCVVAAARAVDAHWWVVPGHTEVESTVVVDATAAEAFFTALAGAGAPDHLEFVVEDPARGVVRGSVRSMSELLARQRRPQVLLAARDRDHRDDVVRNHLAHGSGVRLELWPRRDGRLWASRDNPYTRSVPLDAEMVDVEVDGVAVRTLPDMALPTPTECTFPVDVVCTWVDDTDPVWRERKRAHAPPSEARHQGAGGDARYINRDELRHSLRSLHLFAPWVRRIFLVTAGQVPAWLDESHDRVRVVDHREILPASALPTFNSHAIETGLHRIPGLAEHYLYLNDDVLLNRPVTPDRFFSPDGRYAVFLTDAPIGLHTDEPAAWRSGALNARRLLQRDLGRTTTFQVAHSPHPQRRSTLVELEQRYAEEFDVTAHARFRAPTDCAVPSSLVQYHGLATGQGFPGGLSHAWTQLRAHDLRQRLQRLLAREHHTFCLADHHHLALPPDRVDELVADMLRQHSPVPAPWERG